MLKERLKDLLGSERGEKVLYVDNVDSTNILLQKMAENGAPDGQVVIAEKQSAGRGRLGRSFDSQAGGIYMSYLICGKRVGSIMEITALTALAVKNAIENICSVECSIKWVNDIIVDSKKVCGILAQGAVENNTFKYVVVGIGVNVMQKSRDFPESIRDKATSLYEVSGSSPDIERLTCGIISEMDGIFDIEYAAEKYRAACLTVGKTVKITRGEIEKNAECIDVNDDFSLLVRYDDGTYENISSGEVSVRPKTL